jgi:hypothetical protein
MTALNGSQEIDPPPDRRLLLRVARRAPGPALKVLLAEVAVEERARDGSLREIRSMSSLHHPNIVKLGDSGSSGATFYFAWDRITNARTGGAN